MKNIIKAIRRAMANFQVRSLEATLQGQNDALEMVRDPLTRQCIALARMTTQRELAKARVRYSALLPVGDRRVFEVA